MFVLCDARNGYVYTGKNVVWNDNLLVCGDFHVYMDNYYTSPNLFLTLSGNSMTHVIIPQGSLGSTFPKSWLQELNLLIEVIRIIIHGSTSSLMGIVWVR